MLPKCCRGNLLSLRCTGKRQTAEDTYPLEARSLLGSCCHCCGTLLYQKKLEKKIKIIAKVVKVVKVSVTTIRFVKKGER